MRVLGVALVLLALCWGYASRLEVHSDVMELLPRDSPGFQSFEHQLSRVGGRATITVVAESPERHANERFIDALSAALRTMVATKAECTSRCAGDARCIARCGGPEQIAFVEDGTQRTRAFFQENKWLYANLEELEEADRTLDHQIAIKTGLVEDLAGEPEK